MNLGAYLEQSAAKRPGHTAVVWGDWRLTYQQLNERANRVANAVAGMGLRKGDRCAVYMFNRGEFIEIYLGLAKAGVLAVPVNFRFAEREVAYVLNDAAPKVILFEARLTQTLEAARAQTTSIADGCYVCVDGPAPAWAIPYEEWLKGGAATPPDLAVTRSDPFFIGYTSGTTGFPKGAIVTQGALIENNMLLMLEYGGINCDDTFMTVMPLFHSNSIWFALVLMMAGGTNVIYPVASLDPERAMRVIQDERVTITSVVPTILSMLLAVPPEVRSRYDLSSLRAFLTGSAPLMSKVKEEIMETFHSELYELYGSTETGLVTVLPARHSISKFRSVGRPVLGKEILLLDEEGQPVPQGEVGELWARGFGILLKEYWNKPEANAKSYREGGWRTVGDMAQMDEDGFYYLVDRKADMIISGGENIYPTEIENVLMRHPAVREVAVVGIPDPKWGESLLAVVALRPGTAATQDEILAVCQGQIAKYKWPRAVDFVPELPKNPTGKILRRAIREPYWKGHDGKI